MREIVHIQAGQCGNQIGAKVNSILLFQLIPELEFGRSSGRHFVQLMLLTI